MRSALFFELGTDILSWAHLASSPGTCQMHKSGTQTIHKSSPESTFQKKGSRIEERLTKIRNSNLRRVGVVCLDEQWSDRCLGWLLPFGQLELSLSVSQQSYRDIRTLHSGNLESSCIFVDQLIEIGGKPVRPFLIVSAASAAYAARFSPLRR